MINAQLPGLCSAFDKLYTSDSLYNDHKEDISIEDIEPYSFSGTIDLIELKKEVQNITSCKQYEYMQSKLNIINLYYQNKINDISQKRNILRKNFVEMVNVIKISKSDNRTQKPINLPTEEDCDMVHDKILVCDDEIINVNKIIIQIVTLKNMMEINDF
jgi:hypothetical protein